MCVYLSLQPISFSVHGRTTYNIRTIKLCTIAINQTILNYIGIFLQQLCAAEYKLQSTVTVSHTSVTYANFKASTMAAKQNCFGEFTLYPTVHASM